MSAADYLNKADHAVTSAMDQLSRGDVEGAANRAYYAMFHAARAALMSAGETGIGSHGTVIGNFGLRFVRTGLVNPDHGRAINEAQKLRILSDYSAKQPDPEAVSSIVGKAEEFVAAVRAIIAPGRLSP